MSERVEELRVNDPVPGVSATEYPFASKYHEQADGHRMHYVDEGQGEVVVMVHGNPTWSYYYRNLIKQLSGEYRTIAPDHIGCGFSDKPDDEDYEYTLSRRVADLDHLLSAVVPGDQITFVLHDWGGMIGMVWAVENPDRVGRIVLLNTSAFHLPRSKKFPLPLWLARDTRVGAVLVDKFNAFSRGATRFAVTEKLSPEIARGYEAPYAAPGSRIATLRFVQDIPLKPEDQAYDVVSRTEERLSLFEDRPIFIAWGYKDFVFDTKFLDRWREIYPDAEYVEYPEAGHYILEDRSEELPGLIENFLHQHPMHQG